MTPLAYDPEASAPEPILRFFAYEHLPPHLRAVSKMFHDVAHKLVSTSPARSKGRGRSRGDGMTKGARSTAKARNPRFVAFAKALPEAMLGDTVGDHDAFTAFCERPSLVPDER